MTKEQAEEWLGAFAALANAGRRGDYEKELTREDLLGAARGWLEAKKTGAAAGDWFSACCHEEAKFLMRDPDVAQSFWDCAGLILGVEVPRTDRAGVFVFDCTC